ncbi:hypothetical protein GQ55_2G255100 [Panicum hallii var. hallii]|uniref:Uncharacterized protein n=1 Tax=Panicum hallii var. hallii TaxID=1504633 RepID=A0A2T7ES96_9POAL|nr:hypothetical protein GQ55_2G255100 [Panicum hallii var. hallii]
MRICLSPLWFVTQPIPLIPPHPGLGSHPRPRWCFKNQGARASGRSQQRAAHGGGGTNLRGSTAVTATPRSSSRHPSPPATFSPLRKRSWLIRTQNNI